MNTPAHPERKIESMCWRVRGCKRTRGVMALLVARLAVRRCSSLPMPNGREQ